MSEYQTPDALDRLLADPSIEGRGAALLSSVRKDPFSVVLLDEFEKAAAPIWDLFLQVFDDGRLTDQQGRTADFRRCIVILTVRTSARRSRTGRAWGSRRARALSQRVDRGRAEADLPARVPEPDRPRRDLPALRSGADAALLEKELADALDGGACGRALGGGAGRVRGRVPDRERLHADLGARPLKRALDRHLLTPIAAAIVEHAFPRATSSFWSERGRAGSTRVRRPRRDRRTERDSDAEL